jgi:methylmalonyl-CoA mutase N-terminal domain/subunit
MTLDMVEGAFDYFHKMDAMGGMVAAIERGFPQKEIAEASYQYQRAVERKEKITVGVNEFAVEEEPPITLYIDDSVQRQQVAKLKALRQTRSNQEVVRRLDALKHAAAEYPRVKADGSISDANTMPYIIDAVRAYATVGEICEALKTVYGTYEEASIT